METNLQGRVQPSAIDVEGSILGAILLEKNAFNLASEIINSQAFYRECNVIIFDMMSEMNKSNAPINTQTLAEWLIKKNKLEEVGGPYYLVSLTKSVYSSANIEYDCRVVMEKYIKREIIRIGAEMQNEAYGNDTDVFELLDKTEKNVFDIANKYIKGDYDHISKGLIESVKRIEYLRTLDDKITGVHSGFNYLDNTTHGWQDSDLIVIAARPSVGKTAFALNLARNAALSESKPTSVGFFSLEMSKSQLINRMVARESEIVLDAISVGRIDDSMMNVIYKKAIEPLMNASIYIDDTAAITSFELRAKARRMKAKHGVGLIIIDYLQLMSGDDKNRNREQVISQISRDLKKTAKELNIPIIALSQLSREVEKRGVKIPQLSDLRESGAIEQDADMVIFLYRPDEEEQKDVAVAKISKHRNGKLDVISFMVDNSIQKWEENNEGTFNNIPKNLIPLKSFPAPVNHYEVDNESGNPF